jgi:mono/diheme cytochrome c family protein
MKWHTVINVLLSLNLLGIMATSFFLKKDVTQRQFDVPIMRDMAKTKAHKAFTQNSNYFPVEGTIARGFLPFPYGPGKEEAKRAGEELQNPIVAPADKDLTRGKAVFQNFCMPCHGEKGLGDGLVAKRGFPPPPSLKGENALAMKDGELYHVITLGTGNMPPYAIQIQREDRWKLVHYMRSLQSEVD